MNPQANMQACPCCRRQDYTLVDIVITLNEEQKEAHYKSLMDAYNEDHAYVRPAPRVGREYRPEVRPVRRAVDRGRALPAEGEWDARRAAMLLNFDDAVRDDDFHHAANIRNVLINEGFPLNEVREHNYEALRLQELARVDALVAAAAARRAADEARRAARHEANFARREARAQAHQAAQQAERQAVRQAARENLDGAIVMQTINDHAALEQRFNARHPAGARAQVVLGAGIKIGHLPFNARPMLKCQGCNKKTRRVCDRCDDQYCCASCNNCLGADCHRRPAGYVAHLPANYQRV